MFAEEISMYVCKYFIICPCPPCGLFKIAILVILVGEMLPVGLMFVN
jgi:hypothetical protein